MERQLTRQEALQWMNDHLGRCVAIAIYVELPDNDSTNVLSIRRTLAAEPPNYRAVYGGEQLPAQDEDITRQLEEEHAMYSLGGPRTHRFVGDRAPRHLDRRRGHRCVDAPHRRSALHQAC